MNTIIKTSCAVLMAATMLTGFSGTIAQDKNPFASMKPRLIGPAYPSGRISDFAMHPETPNLYYAATSSGGIWKTHDNGTTWKPIFDRYGSYAIGVIEMDPNDVNTIWAGTGENNAQRSAARGDGIYKSIDGGKSWKNMGLKTSAHISDIWINPANSDHVLVASQGPLWSEGGDRGLFKTEDGGKTWVNVLKIDQHTGVNEIVVDAANPNNIIASTYQRRRHVWTMINGGPGGGIHRSTDGGTTWTKIKSGLPTGDIGRIGLSASPAQPGLVYAIVEAAKGQGIYASEDFGVTWQKRSSHMTTAPFYYNEIVADPHKADRLYSLDTFSKVSEDGGRTWSNLGISARHVDDHALWIDPDNTDHLIIGGDGGIYESYDQGKRWRHMENLPVTQFYRATPDNALPFYSVCGGTQDNNSLCAPSRTTVVHGITNADWKIILGGDGYKSVTDPTDTNIIYTQYQYGGLARYDRRTQERIYITPQPASGENAYKWNWNTPIILSPHKTTRIYYAAEKLFVSDDRGDNWRVVSPDLTRQLDRNKLEVMGRVWSENAIGKNDSTSMYGSIIGLSESPLQEGLIMIGTDDGLIQVTENGGESWRKVDSFKGVPDMSLIEDVITSVHDVNVAYAVVDNHKRGDEKPYVLKTTDKGKKWSLISGNLPERGTVHTIAEDHEDPDLLFVGTEYGLFFTQDGGENWHPIKSGFPTISVRDLEIQRRENDLVIATFGRGIYILDDYSPLRSDASDVANAEATMFPVKDAWQYIVGDLWGGSRRGSHGDNFYSADNPAYGAVFSYHLKAGYKTAKATRLSAEAKRQKKGEDNPYPSFDTLRTEDREEAPTVMLTISDADGNVVRRIKGKNAAGLHRTAWNLRLDGTSNASLSGNGGTGPYAAPGEYSVQLSARINGELKPLGAPQSFMVKSLNLSPENTQDRAALLAFQQKTADLRRAVNGSITSLRSIENRIKLVMVALDRTPDATEEMQQALRSINARVQDLSVALLGDRSISSRNEPTPMSINARVGSIIQGHWRSLSDVTGLHKRAYEIAATEFTAALAELKSIDADLATLEAEAGSMGAPHTPGTIPDWKDT